jgi:4-hydroxythreonine-4-phosphate dehydrogenase
VVRTIAVTVGDPAGIGPEVVARALSCTFLPGVRFLAVGSEQALKAGAEKMRVSLDVRRVASAAELDESRVQLLQAGVEAGFTFGAPSPDTGRAALAAVSRAADLALARQVDAVVTAPVSKKHVADAGVPFTGHTEYLAARAGVRHPVMLFVAEGLRVALVTTHLPLRKVAPAITVERVVATARQTAAGLRAHFGVLEPRLALAGVNPHAGEGGQFGREEIDVLAPALELLRKEGLRISGPHAADTLFRRAMDGEFDAVVAMYHDQALGPVKTVARDAVNVTLGLPFIRTSVDHGTAFDIAGHGKADAGPMMRALRVAHDMMSANKALF